MFGLFRAKQSDNPPKNYREAKKLIRRLGTERGGQIIRDEARAGDLFCQIFLSQSAVQLMSQTGDSGVQKDAFMYTEMAANAGDEMSQFNLGKLYMFLIDASAEHFTEIDIHNIRKAKYWYDKAAAQGNQMAKQFSNDLKDI